MHSRDEKEKSQGRLDPEHRKFQEKIDRLLELLWEAFEKRLWGSVQFNFQDGKFTQLDTKLTEK